MAKLCYIFLANSRQYAIIGLSFEENQILIYRMR